MLSLIFAFWRIRVVSYLLHRCAKNIFCSHMPRAVRNEDATLSYSFFIAKFSIATCHLAQELPTRYLILNSAFSSTNIPQDSWNTGRKFHNFEFVFKIGLDTKSKLYFNFAVQQSREHERNILWTHLCPVLLDFNLPCIQQGKLFCYSVSS